MTRSAEQAGRPMVLPVWQDHGSGHARGRVDTRSRWADALLIGGPVVYFLAELIAAAAWSDPPYSYTYHFISNLGVSGPSTLFGQYMHSPLAGVMNTGFFLFGITILVGVALVRGLRRWRHLAVLVPASLLGAGGILLALFPGSGEALQNGTGELHSLGAFAGFVGGNVLVILLGTLRSRVALSRSFGALLVTAGIIGLLSMVLYFGAIVSSGDTVSPIIGLIERGVVYPFLIALICAGTSLVRRRRSGETFVASGLN